MDQDTVKRVIAANVGRWVRVRTVYGASQFMFIINVDEEGYVNKINEDDELFWTTFDDIQAVWSVGDLNVTEPD